MEAMYLLVVSLASMSFHWWVDDPGGASIAQVTRTLKGVLMNGDTKSVSAAVGLLGQGQTIDIQQIEDAQLAEVAKDFTRLNPRQQLTVSALARQCLVSVRKDRAEVANALQNKIEEWIAKRKSMKRNQEWNEQDARFVFTHFGLLCEVAGKANDLPPASMPIVIEYVERKENVKTGGGKVIVGHLEKDRLTQLKEAGRVDGDGFYISTYQGLSAIVQAIVERVDSDTSK